MTATPATQADPAVCAAFSSGWVIAQLHGPILQRPLNPTEPLPTINELGRAQRATLAIDVLDAMFAGALAEALKPVADQTAISTAAVRAAVATVTADDLGPAQRSIEALHTDVLTRLTVAARRLGSAYMIGRSLSDTCWLPNSLDSFKEQFNRYRLANLQGWLEDVGSGLAPGSASAVSQSLDNWAAWTDVHAGLDWAASGGIVTRAAKAQGEHWRSLLSGDKDPAALLTPEAYVEGGEKALARAAKIVRRVFAHFWLPITFVLLLTVIVTVIAVAYSQGTAKLWASLLPIATGLGVTGTSVKATAKRLATDAGKPLLDLATTDAMGWACTSLPALADTKQQQKQLRRRGVAAPTRPGPDTHRPA